MYKAVSLFACDVPNELNRVPKYRLHTKGEVTKSLGNQANQLVL